MDAVNVCGNAAILQSCLARKFLGRLRVFLASKGRRGPLGPLVGACVSPFTSFYASIPNPLPSSFRINAKHFCDFSTIQALIDIMLSQPFIRNGARESPPGRSSLYFAPTFTAANIFAIGMWLPENFCSANHAGNPSLPFCCFRWPRPGPAFTVFRRPTINCPYRLFICFSLSFDRHLGQISFFILHQPDYTSCCFAIPAIPALLILESGRISSPDAALAIAPLSSRHSFQSPILRTAAPCV